MAENKSNDSIGKTLLVVLVLCLVCSIVVAGSAVGLKSRQQEQRALDKQRNILAVAGLMKQGMSADEVADIFKAHISPRLVDLASGELLDKDPGKFNQAQALKDPQQSLQLEASQDPAGIKRRSNIAEIYLVRDEKQQIQEVVLPIYGNGLWSVMYALWRWKPMAARSKGSPITITVKRRGWAGKLKTPTGASSSSVNRCLMIKGCLR